MIKTIEVINIRRMIGQTPFAHYYWLWNFNKMKLLYPPCHTILHCYIVPFLNIVKFATYTILFLFTFFLLTQPIRSTGLSLLENIQSKMMVNYQQCKIVALLVNKIKKQKQNKTKKPCVNHNFFSHSELSWISNMRSQIKGKKVTLNV